jgi:hypothetical protein
MISGGSMDFIDFMNIHSFNFNLINFINLFSYIRKDEFGVANAMISTFGAIPTIP